MRKRSKYRPKPIIQDVIQHVLTGMTLVGDTSTIRLARTRVHGSMVACVQGVATRQDVDNISHALNTSLGLCILGLGQDWSKELGVALRSLRSMKDRGVYRDDRFIFTGVELTAVNLGVEVYDQQLDVCTVAQLELAIREVTYALQRQEEEAKHKARVLARGS